ncbi:hypothetical protein K474DRAFT_1707917 [Panus rudis PR-1116 ss-1]|nr:hypothetical protein K474DRAFT_1707917 [Panus rudis PR-1116 ss-1]
MSIVSILVSPRAEAFWRAIDYYSHIFGSRIRKVLAQYFRRPALFYWYQAICGTIVSGSTLILILDQKTTVEPGDLDIYCPYEDADTMVGYLQDREEYCYCPIDKQPLNPYHAIAQKRQFKMNSGQYTNRVVSAVLNFVRTETGIQRVQLVVTHTHPVIAMLKYHSTCVMNFFTSDCIYCLYPQATLVQHRSMICRKDSDDLCPLVEKYHARGYDMLSSFAEGDNTFAPFRRRLVTDCWSWIIPFYPVAHFRPSHDRCIKRAAKEMRVALQAIEWYFNPYLMGERRGRMSVVGLDKHV